SANTPLFKTPLEIKIPGAAGDTVVRIFIDQNNTTFNIPVSNTDTGLVVDPNQWIPNGHGTVLFDTSIFVSSVQTIAAPVQKYSVYPNPASGYLNIHTAMHNQIVDAALYNSLGQLVYNSKVATNTQIKLPQLPDGLYVLQINNCSAFKVVISN
ncbi:MAG: type sorting protein, partial [Bacteroidota bacterium]|nr:type sorting protein [Bacteroidota bacterium]